MRSGVLLIVPLLAAACTAPLPAVSPQGSAPPPPAAAAPPEPKPAPKAEPAPAPKPSTAAKPPTPAQATKPTPAQAGAQSPAPKPTPAQAGAQSTPPPLDLRSLEQRLKDSAAIGVLTKLSLKNQVDDLIAQFREYHSGRRPPTLPELRRPFELLLMKVLSLLQDKDGALARDINASREAIWGVLTDRDKLAQFQ